MALVTIKKICKYVTFSFKDNDGNMHQHTVLMHDADSDTEIAVNSLLPSLGDVTLESIDSITEEEVDINVAETIEDFPALIIG